MSTSQFSPRVVAQHTLSGETAGKPPSKEPTEMLGDSATATLCKDVSGYVAAVILTLVVLTVTLQLWNADLTVPFGYGGGDGMMYLALVKSTLDNGWYLDNDRLARPDGQNMRDFPMPDVLHFGVDQTPGRVFQRPGGGNQSCITCCPFL